MKARPLSERQEQVLCRFLDGEGHYLDRFQAKWLLKNNPRAREFVREIEQVGHVVCVDLNRVESCPDLDRMWGRISQRIDNEERAALYLGERVLLPSQQRPASQQRPESLMSRRYGWGVAGLASAACIAFFVVGFETNSSAPAGGRLVATGSSEQVVARSEGSAVVDLVSSNPQEQVSRSRLIGDFDSHGVEVDWMRSQGHVRVIPDSERRSGIIWVKRKRPQNLLIQGPNSSGIRILEGGSAQGGAPRALSVNND